MSQFQKKLADEDRQLIADYIWKSLGSDIKMGIATVGEETAFSFEYQGNCIEIGALLPLLKLKHLDSDGCQWMSQFSGEILKEITGALLQ